MEIGIIGLPGSGKTTLFNSLTRGKAETRAFAGGAVEPNVGVVKVPDRRLEGLQLLLKPKRLVPAEVKYVDVAVAPDKREGLSGPARSHLTKTDALISVARAFTDETVPLSGGVDPWRDIGAMSADLVLADLVIAEHRLQRIGESLKGAKSPERENLVKEQAFVERVRASLESGVAVRDQGLSKDEGRTAESYQFLSSKPLLVVLNIGEGQLPQAVAVEEEAKKRYPRFNAAAICAKLEMELGQLSDAEASEFRLAMGVGEGAMQRIIRLSFDLMGMVSFFSTASGEVRAWTVRRDTPAPRAAGKIHSDMERGFIRAEVVAYNDLVKCGSMAEAKKHGLLRLEGKNYLVQDGDVITFLFSV
ncbi:MAG: redox-regulated ATPase YchF [Dehalococcoidia bacterium]|nr:redox-regulated ATPase YchF [Dehalococcoidia bacterium]